MAVSTIKKALADPVPVAHGGTGSSTAASARVALGITPYVGTALKTGSYEDTEQTYTATEDGFLIALQVAAPGTAAGYCKVNGYTITVTDNSGTAGRNSVAAGFVKKGDVIKWKAMVLRITKLLS